MKAVLLVVCLAILPFLILGACSDDPKATATPIPTATHTSVPLDTATLTPRATSTSVPTATLIPTAAPTPVPTATPTPTATPYTHSDSHARAYGNPHPHAVPGKGSTGGAVRENRRYGLVRQGKLAE